MELQSSESKKLFKVFDGAKRKRVQKKRDGPDDSNSVATDDSNCACPANVARTVSRKESSQRVPAADTEDGHRNNDSATKERDSNTTIHREEHRSPRRNRRPVRDANMSFALKAGVVGSPRSATPPTGDDAAAEQPSQDQDSLIYAFLEEAIKRDKRKHRHGRRYEGRHGSYERDHDRGRERDPDRGHERDRGRGREKDRGHENERECGASGSREQNHRQRRHRNDVISKDRDSSRPKPASPDINQTVLLETFAKFCAQMNEKSVSPVPRTQSHKSLQCEVASRRDLYNSERPPERLDSLEHTYGINTPTRIRSQGNCRQSGSREKVDSRQDRVDSRYGTMDSRPDKCPCRYNEPKIDYDIEPNYVPRMDHGPEAKYTSKIDVSRSRAVVSRMNEGERYRGYHPPENVATRTCIGTYRDRLRDRDHREFDRRQYEDDRRRRVEQKTSRSFEAHREGYEEERCRRTSRSDPKDKPFDDKYYDKTMIDVPRHFPKERLKRPVVDRDHFDRNSVVSREEDYRERDRLSERERDSGLSVADGDTSTVSGRTGRSYMKAVKQEIAEQREAMDKMMMLWKELMRCFKGISQDKDKSMNESACENVRESAAAQLRLWRECMRRYETVARDVGDTDARLMEEINKQRSEMSEMANMWQECLQRYRDMSNDFNTLKQQLTTAESPTRLPPTSAPLVCAAEGERPAPAPPPHSVYHIPQTYSQMPPNPAPGFPCVGSPLRGRASAPPAWWWGGEHPRARQRSSRRSSPESRDGRDTDRDRRHRNKETRELVSRSSGTPVLTDKPHVSRHKEKSSKPSAARSEHRRRKR